MAGRNLEIVRRAFQELRKGDDGGGAWDPDVEVVNAAGWVIETTYRGHTGLRRWWEDLAEAFGDFDIELDEALEVDDERVLTTQRFVGRSERPRFHSTVLGRPFSGSGKARSYARRAT
jgi:ketosteroid isomerase-like protein